MENTQNHGRSVGKVTTTFNGEKIQVEVFEDRSVILPDGTVRKVKQEVVDALLAKQQAAAPTPAPAPAPAANPVVIQMNPGTQRSAPIPVAPAGQFYKPAPAAPAQQTPAPVQPASQPNFYQQPQPAEPAQSMDSFDGATPMPVTKKKKGKAGIIVAAVLAVVVAGSGLMYAFVPSFYDGVNGVLTSVTGKQVGVPPVATSDDGGSTTPQTTTQTPAGTGENALDGVDLSGNVSIDFYATVRTADGREYKVPLSTANLSDGVLTSLLDGSGFTLTTNGQ